MKKSVRMISEDLKNLENLDIYIAIIALIIFTIIDLFKDITNLFPKFVTLALIPILYSVLKIIQALSQLPVGLSHGNVVFQDQFDKNLHEQILDSEDLYFIGVTLEKTIINYYSHFSEKLKKGHKIRILMVNPDSNALDIAETRNFTPTNSDSTRVKMKQNINSLCLLMEKFRDNISVRLINNSLTHGLVGVNMGKKNGQLFVEHYPYKTIGGSLPKFVLKKGENMDRWYTFFQDEAEIFWQEATPVTCPAKSHGK